MPIQEIRIPYEMRIGVTGHRDLSDPEGVTAAVEKLISRIDRRLNRKDRTSVDWVVISLLARGADRVVARTVLSRPRARLEVVTPFALAEYCKDFVEPEDLAEFEDLRKQADPLVELDGNVPTPEQRNTGYLRVGKAVVDSCEILIAIWDGKPATGEGGTADIVEYALQQERLILWIDSENPTRPAHLLVRNTGRRGWLYRLLDGLLALFGRKQKAGEADVPGVSRFSMARIPAKARKLSLGYWHLDAFNRDVSVKRTRYEAAIEKKVQELTQCAKAAELPDARVQSVIDNILPYFVHADELAIHYERRHVLASKAIFVLSALAVTIAVFQTLFFPHLAWLIAFEIAAMLALLLFFGLNRWRSWHEKWLHDRHFAEQMRTATYALTLSGDPAMPLVEPRKTLSFYAGPRNWLHAAIRQVIINARQPKITAAELEPVKRYLIEGWLKEQRKYHFDNARKREKAAHKVHWSVVILMGATLAMATLHLFGIGHGHSEIPLLLPELWITFLAIVLPAWGAAIHGIGKQLEYERIAARSEKMAEVISQSIDNVEYADTVEKLEQVVGEVARLMGLENYEWWVLLSFDKAVPVV